MHKISPETFHLLRQSPGAAWERAAEEIRVKLMLEAGERAAEHPPGSPERAREVEILCGVPRALDALLGLVRQCGGDG